MGRRTTYVSSGLQVAALVTALLCALATVAEYRFFSYWSYLLSYALCVVTLIVMRWTGDGGLAGRLHDACFRNHWTVTLRQLLFQRFQLCLAVFLGGFPFVAMFPLERLMRNLFAVQPLDVFFITWLSLTATWALMAGSTLIWRYSSLRFGGPRPRLQPWLGQFVRSCRLVLFAVPALPMICGAWWFCFDRGWGAVGVLCGVGAAWATLGIATITRELTAPPESPPSDLLLNGAAYRDLRDRAADANQRPGDRGVAARFATPGVLLLFKTLGRGYFDTARGRPLPGHFLALNFMWVTILIYAVIGVLFAPDGHLHDYFPSLGYLLLLFNFLVWAVPAATFLLDRWRVPVFTVLLGGTLSFYSMSTTDHYFPTPRVRGSDRAGRRHAPGTPPRSEGRPVRDRVRLTRTAHPRPRVLDDLVPRGALPPAIAYQRWQRHRDEAGESADRMVVVASSGGGITAAVWTAHVLAGLEEKYGSRFTRSLGAISCVSGGSVGTMYYLDGFSADAPRPPEQLRQVTQAAGAPSLRATSWGIAYIDLWRLVTPPLVKWVGHRDRGWAMQEQWRRRMCDPQASLQRWRSKVAAGELPTPLFNATAVETGYPFLLTPIDLPESGEGLAKPYESFLQRHPQRDVDVVVAARMSATFPWVTPIARPQRAPLGEMYHLADGAYYDNHGVATLVEWLRASLPAMQQAGKLKQILMIRINASPAPEATTVRGAPVLEPMAIPGLRMKHPIGESGWTFAVYGPLEALLRVNATSQRARNEQVLGLLVRNAAVEITVVDFYLPQRAPLSWKLAPETLRQIAAAWRSLADHDDTASPVQQVGGFLNPRRAPRLTQRGGQVAE